MQTVLLILLTKRRRATFLTLISQILCCNLASFSSFISFSCSLAVLPVQFSHLLICSQQGHPSIFLKNKIHSYVKFLNLQPSQTSVAPCACDSGLSCSMLPFMLFIYLFIFLWYIRCVMGLQYFLGFGRLKGIRHSNTKTEHKGQNC